jgi:type VI secretion system protein ImpA
MKERVAHRQASAAHATKEEPPVPGGVNGAPSRQEPPVGGGGAPLNNATGAAVGDIRSREDVLRALDAICSYYSRNEPSSPVPLLLERCKRLVTMSFVDIVKDMLPEALTAIQTIAGTRNE